VELDMLHTWPKHTSVRCTLPSPASWPHCALRCQVTVLLEDAPFTFAWACAQAYRLSAAPRAACAPARADFPHLSASVWTCARGEACLPYPLAHASVRQPPPRTVRFAGLHAWLSTTPKPAPDFLQARQPRGDGGANLQSGWGEGSLAALKPPKMPVQVQEKPHSVRARNWTQHLWKP